MRASADCDAWCTGFFTLDPLAHPCGTERYGKTFQTAALCSSGLLKTQTQALQALAEAKKGLASERVAASRHPGFEETAARHHGAITSTDAAV